MLVLLSALSRKRYPQDPPLAYIHSK